ncbi:hypothetical protein [Pseudogemmobacter blasticus]|uniref:Uncharacterized protein n=1 Tax=Fuscovulum blasticum DSM 2131 TaxID=1188250 RepID=A0A2T4JDP6_FUSBL|nr:hypothetical protein [Fuscovulum blasticum]PTE16016.1 hypothetical protein C5F44_02995 [Fuscovulum blasticum DSM 2131]
MPYRLAPLFALVLAGPALAQNADQILTVNGHSITVSDDGEGTDTLTVDDKVVHTDGDIFLDSPEKVGGETVISGVSGPGGNACNAAPFVLVLPQGGPARLDGPVETCNGLTLEVRPEALIWTGEATPSLPGEVWSWTPEHGFVAGKPESFASTATLDWDALPTLAEKHPVEALKIKPVEQELKSALGASWPQFADRISELGSGGLVDGNYLGEACLKFTCDEDYAGLYLDAAKRKVFAFWHVGDAKAPMVYPDDLSLWPEPALAALKAHTGG